MTAYISPKILKYIHISSLMNINSNLTYLGQIIQDNQMRSPGIYQCIIGELCQYSYQMLYQCIKQFILSSKLHNSVPFTLWFSKG